MTAANEETGGRAAGGRAAGGDAGADALSQWAAALERRPPGTALAAAWCPPLWRRVLAVPMFLLTVVYGLAAGVVLGMTGFAAYFGAPALEYRLADPPGDRSFFVAGWVPGLVIGAVLVLLASIQNRLRRRMLRPPKPKQR